MVLPDDAYQNQPKIIIIHNDRKKSKLAIVLFERKKKDILRKKLDTDFKNSLGCAVVAYKNSGVKNFMISENIVSCN